MKKPGIFTFSLIIGLIIWAIVIVRNLLFTDTNSILEILFLETGFEGFPGRLLFFIGFIIVGFYATMEIRKRSEKADRKDDKLAKMKSYCDTAIKMCNFPTDENHHKYILDKVIDISDARIAIFADTKEDGFQGKVIKHSINQSMIKYRDIFNLLNIENREFFINPIDLEPDPTGDLKIIDKSLKIIFNEVINNDIETQLIKLIGPYKIIVFPVVNGALNQGVVFLVLRKNDELKNRELLEAFLRQSAAFLRKRKIQDELIRNEKQYRHIFENMIDVYYRCDLNGDIELTTPSALRLFGYDSMDDLIGLNIRRDFYFNPEDRDEFLEKLYKENYVNQYELPLKNRYGKKILVETNSKLIRNSNGEPVAVEGIIRDMTEHFKSAAKIKQSEESYRLTIDSMADYIHVCDTDMQLLLINRPLREFANISDDSDSIIGSHFMDIFKFQGKKATSTFKQVLKSGQILTFEEKYKIGAYQYIMDIRMIPIKENGKVIRVITILRDITAERNAEQNRILAEKKNRLILNIIPDLMIHADGGGIILNHNTSGIEDLKIERNSLVGKHLSEFVPIDLAYEMIENIQDVIESDEPKSFEYQMELNSLPRSFEIRMVKCGDNEVLSMSRDVTERNRTEEALRESEERHRKITENSPDIISRFDKNARCLFLSENVSEFTGLPAENFIGKTISEMQESDLPKIFKENVIKKVFITGDSSEEEFHFHSHNKELWLNRRLIPEYDQDENIISVMGITRDFTARRKNELVKDVIYEISKSTNISKDLFEFFKSIKKNLAKVLDTTNFFIALYDENTDTISLPFFEDTKDNFKSFPAGKTLTSYLIRNNRSLLLKEKDILNLQKSKIVEFIGTPSKVWLGVPLKVDSDVIGAVVVQHYEDENCYSEEDKKILQFVSDQIAIAIKRKSDEDEIIELNKELEQRVIDRTAKLQEALEELKVANDEAAKALVKEKELNDLKTRFISMVSHEYRTPLTVILSSTYLLENYFKEDNPEEHHKHLGWIQEAVKAMTELLDDVLVYGRSEEGTFRINPIKIDLNSAISSVIQEIKIADNNRHTINFQAESKHIDCHTDPNMIQHILTNLLTNATKYSPEGLPIDVVVRSANNDVEIEVKDKGIGIPEKDQKNLFQHFFRSTNVGTISGTGLGLSIVKRAVEALNGKIKFDSVENKGTTFSIRIPRGLN